MPAHGVTFASLLTQEAEGVRESAAPGVNNGFVARAACVWSWLPGAARGSLRTPCLCFLPCTWTLRNNSPSQRGFELGLCVKRRIKNNLQAGLNCSTAFQHSLFYILQPCSFLNASWKCQTPGSFHPTKSTLQVRIVETEGYVLGEGEKGIRGEVWSCSPHF